MPYDLLIRGGTVYDGSGASPVVADVAVAGDEIVAVGALADAEASTVIDARGFAVAPGFVNMLSHSTFTVLADGRSLGELKQGVTTQVMGEGTSMGPLTPEQVEASNAARPDAGYPMAFTRLSEYLRFVESRGCSQNVASFVGATTLRINAVGHDDRPATPAELDRMRALVREEMQDGAMGVSSALIYPPGHFASTQELTELCRAASPYGGTYISHLRSEGDAFLEALDELLTIARDAEVNAEVYHLKAAGPQNWPKMDAAIERIEAARAAGLPVTADVYTYTAGATGLASAIPPRFHDGGTERLYERLADPGQRKAMREAIERPGEGWENLYLAAGRGDGVLILSCRRDEHRRFQGMRLSQVAAEMGMDEVDAMLELVARDRSRIGTAYFIISEDNLRTQLALPWVSIGSDAGSMAAEGRFLQSSTHPRSYGTFARFLGRYVREQQVTTLPEAIRRMTSLPCEVLSLSRRGLLREGCFADVVVFDPQTVADRATYEDPHVYSVGVRDVVVNGVVTLHDGEHTGRFAGRALRRG